MALPKLRYSQFAHSIDVDAFEEAIGWAPETTDHKGNDIGFCPDPWNLHKNGDTSGKFAIHRDKRVYNCWVCGGGSLLSLVMAVKDWDEETALDFLYEFTVEPDQSDEAYLDEIEQILAVEKRQSPAPPWFNEHVLDKWMDNRELVDAWNAGEFDPRPRGISDEVLDEFKVGADFDHRRRSRSKGEYVGPGILLPHYWGGRLVGWQVRWLDDERPGWVPKYTNTHDFPREETIFNYERVYLSTVPIVVVESVPTVLFLASLDIPAVATFGSSVSDDQIRLLRKCQQGVVLAPDNDKPGYKWLFADPKRPDVVPLAEALARYVPVRVTEPVGVDGDGGDLADLASDPETARDLIADAIHYW